MTDKHQPTAEAAAGEAAAQRAPAAQVSSSSPPHSPDEARQQQQQQQRREGRGEEAADGEAHKGGGEGKGGAAAAEDDPPSGRKAGAGAAPGASAGGAAGGKGKGSGLYSSVNLPPSVVRSLSDKSYEKRKAGAIEIEKLIRERAEASDGETFIVMLINILTMDYACSINSNQRKGGLIGLAAVSLGLGTAGTPTYLQYLLPPVLKCFDDPEVRVRYYACEALYNIAKVARKDVLFYFNALFDGLCKLFADVDVDVKNGAQLLDRLVKEIVTENSTTFQVGHFIPLLEKYLQMTNPYIRQFLLGWITALDSVPDIDMLAHLPKFLGGMFNMLSDGNREIRQQSDMALNRFLAEIQACGSDNFEDQQLVGVVGILVMQATRPQKFNRLTAVAWVSRFVEVFGERLRLQYSGVLDLLLESLSDSEPEIQAVAGKAHTLLLELVRESDEPFDLRKVIVVVTKRLAIVEEHTGGTPGSGGAGGGGGGGGGFDGAGAGLGDGLQARLQPSVNATVHGDLRRGSGGGGGGGMSSFAPPGSPLTPLGGQSSKFMASMASTAPIGSLPGSAGPETPLPTRLAALKWISLLLDKFPKDMEEQIDKLTPAMLNALSDPSDDLVMHDLEVLARIARNTSRMDAVIGHVIRLFRTDRALFDNRGSFIVRTLCVLLEPSKVYLILANEIDKEQDMAFAHLMVQALNLILLTAPELSPFRAKLQQSWKECCSEPRAAREGSPESEPVFAILYRTWCFDPVATLSLCLLSKCYDLSSKLVVQLADIHVSVGFLMEVDKLVELLESPAFLNLRLELVNTGSAFRPALLKTLYGLLMILPQTGAYHTLAKRLNAASSLHLAIASGAPAPQHVSAPSPASRNASSSASRGKKNMFSKLMESQSKDRDDSEASSAGGGGASGVGSGSGGGAGSGGAGSGGGGAGSGGHRRRGSSSMTENAAAYARQQEVEREMLEHFAGVQRKLSRVYEQAMQSKSLFATAAPDS